MTPALLRKVLFYPDRVALIGASGSAGRLTARPQTFLAAHGFPGEVFPVNPGRTEVLGLPAYPSIGDVPGGPIDHAYIMLDADPALVALEQCARAGARLATVLADGFAEGGAEGAVRQARLEAISAEYGIAVLGPNSMGVAELSRGFVCTTNAAFAADALPGGTFAVLSQSGSMIGALLSRGAAAGIGFRAYVSTGNEACLGVGEIGQALVDDPGIEGFALFLETLRRPEEVARFAAMAHAAGKPVIAYLLGRSAAGTALAASHTGAMTGGARALEAFLAAHGIQRVDTFEALAELANAMSIRARLARRPRRVTVVTTTGGGGGMALDQIGLQDVPLSGMTDATRTRLAGEGLDIKPGPLVDVTLAGARYETMKAVVSALAEDPETGLVLAAIGSSAQFNPELAVAPIVDTVAEAGPDRAPIAALPIPHAPDSLKLFNAGGVPAFRTPESAAESIRALFDPAIPQLSEAASLPEKVRARLDAAPAGAMTEPEAAALFADLGVAGPPGLVIGPDTSLPDDIGFAGPYALKVVSPDIQHKSDAGGVALGLTDAAAVAAALAEMRQTVASRRPDAGIEGFLIQKMATGLGEAIVGLTRDPVVGPIISVGFGGVLTEIYQDLSLRPAPVGPGTAAGMLDEVKGFALLRGYRGAPPGDLAALADAVAAISRLAGHPRVREAEINPVLIGPAGQGVTAADALVILGPTEDSP